ncbi:UNVERIFIED_ORG: head-tail adaptor [Xanthobacter viscosus]|uniref:Head-tail adaptor protein n=1 Tax=Xanthobacter autotrophicus TaxID=280 RepID=A0A6C1KKE6_XANAU|nr:head-tail adaptor protein [Xanthobacter autotrophicus]TLX44798.1 head-tail adaptor protein [Xanthobacter autotrophicus]
MKNAPVRAGSLLEKLTVERAATAVGDFGNTVTLWTPIFDVRAELIEHTQEEEPADTGSRITIRASFSIRHTSALTMTDRVIWGGEAFDIVGLKALGRKQALQVDVRRVGP